MKKKKAEPVNDFDDFDIVRGIVNQTRQFPKSSAKFIKAQMKEIYPGVTDEQLGRCCKMITDSWAIPSKVRQSSKVQGKNK
jgi:hypothetical protein